MRSLKPEEFDAVIELSPDGGVSCLHEDWLHTLGGKVRSRRVGQVEPEGGQWRVRVAVSFEAGQTVGKEELKDLGLFRTRQEALQAEKSFFLQALAVKIGSGRLI